MQELLTQLHNTCRDETGAGEGKNVHNFQTKGLNIFFFKTKLRMPKKVILWKMTNLNAT